MKTYLIVTEHSVQYTYMIEANTQQEAVRQILENEVEGNLTDEGDKQVISVEVENEQTA